MTSYKLVMTPDLQLDQAQVANAAWINPMTCSLEMLDLSAIRLPYKGSFIQVMILWFQCVFIHVNTNPCVQYTQKLTRSGSGAPGVPKYYPLVN